MVPAGDFPIPAEDLRHLLNGRYAIPVGAIERVPIGENTLNYRAFGAKDSYFLKLVEAEHATSLEASILRTMRVLGAGFATPSAIPADDGCFVAVRGDWAVSLWHWEPGEVVTAGWTDSQCARVGRGLADLHRFLRETEPHDEPGPSLYEWARATLETGRARAEEMMAMPVAPEWTDHVRWRIETSDRLLTAAHKLTGTAQPVHGDFSVVNLLFRGNYVTTTDFSPPIRGHIEYELGRVAFAPQFVAGRENDWRRRAKVLIDAYAKTEERDPQALFETSMLTFLIAMVGSYYAFPTSRDGVPSNPSLDVFWEQRVMTARSLHREFTNEDDL
jgi:Ser/Thr protein kinase RdoA (MazF antagonist)